MALTKPAVNPTPKFEDEGSTAIVDRPVAVTVATAAPSTATFASVPAVAGNTSLAVGGKFVNIRDTLLNAMPPMPFNSLPTLKVKSGIIVDEAGNKLGTHATVEILSFNYKWQASPGEEGAEAAKCLRTSYDGKTIDGDGADIMTYIEQMKTDGYANAKLTRRVDVIGVLIASDKESDHKGNLVMVDLAPTSTARFEGQLGQASMKVARGMCSKEQASQVKFSAIAKEGGGRSWSGLDTTSAVL